MEIFKILEQIALLPINAARAVVDLVRKGTSIPINLTVTFEGKKVGLETRAYLFEDEAKKAAQPAAPAAP